jgi:DNA-binding CsgD family transcriptional regulator
VATARVTATRSASGLPFGALAPLLPAAQSEAGAVDDKADLLRRSAAALVERAAGRRLVLFIDDAHLLDDASATLVHQLVATGASAVVATLRSGEAAPDAIVAVWKDGLAERVELEGLDSGAIAELLASALSGPVDPASAARLADRCQGNVLFLRELVLGALRKGALRDEGGIWRLIGPLAPSERLVELVEARLGSLTAEERGLLELLSFAEPLGAAELDALADAAVAEGLERKGLLRSGRDGRRVEVRLAHPIYGDVLRARLPVITSRVMAGSLAGVVEATGALRREDTLRLATWRLDGGGARPDLMLAGATMARWRYDFPLAERLARAAMEAGAGFDAALLAAQLASLQGRHHQAEVDLAHLAAQAAGDMQRSLVAVARIELLGVYLVRLDDGRRVAEEAEAAISDPALRDAVTARASALLLAAEGPQAGADAAAPLVQRAQGPALAWGCLVAGFSLARLGRFAEALEAARRGYAEHQALTQPLDWYPWVHLFFRCEALAHAGRLEESEALALGQYQQALADRSDEAQAWWAWRLAKTVGDQGHVQVALYHGREALALFRKIGRPLFINEVLGYVAMALALSGRAREAKDALRAVEDLGLSATMYSAVDLQQARAWTAAAGGDLRGARRGLEEAAALGRRIGDRVGEAAALHGVARLGDAKSVVRRLTELADEVEGELVPARAAFATAAARGDAERLEEVSSQFETMAATLLAAEAAAEAAVLWSRAGNPKRAAGAGVRAGVLAERCQGAVTPALQAVETRARLTPAEHETAVLAATGHSNKDIADELFITVRSVENRLQRVYNKLGISSRTELAAALDPSTHPAL